MEIRLRATGEVISDREFYVRSPKAPFPLTAEWLDTWGADVVLEGPQATGGTVYQYSQRDGVQEIEGKWYTKYILGPIFYDNENGTAAENEAAYKARIDAERAKFVRDQRNNLIAETDWTQARDVNLANDDAYVAYRQALRDVPAQVGFPWTVEWPVKP